MVYMQVDKYTVWTDQYVFDVCCKQFQYTTFVRHCSYYLTYVLHTYKQTYTQMIT